MNFRLSRKALLWLAAVLLLLPAVELWGIIRISRHIGGGTTLLLMIGTGILGAWLAGREWRSVRLEAGRQAQAGQMPGLQLLDGICIGIGGLLLMLPGFITDLFGLLLLLPPSRRFVRGLMLGWLEKRMRGGGMIRRW